MDVRLPSIWKIEGVTVWHERLGDKLQGRVRQGSDGTWIHAKNCESVVLPFQRTLFQDCCSWGSLFCQEKHEWLKKVMNKQCVWSVD